jgi:predicted MFS family arabinose efflux permease
MSPETTQRHRPIYLYFGFLTLLIYFLAPEYLLDIPTSYMLKNRLHASAPEVSMFRLLSGIPLYVAFLFGLVRDLWNPFGWRDRGYFFLFAPLTAAVFLWMAFTPLSWAMLLTGMILAMATFRLMFAAYQGLIALIGQETSLSGRLSTLSNTAFTIGVIIAAFISGLLSENLSPKQIFILIAIATLSMAFFGLWKPRAVFGHAYDQPQARGSDFSGDVKRLLKHRAIYPAVLITFLWNFNPGLYTPMQFYLTDKLHAPDDAYSNFLGIFIVGIVPTALLYGWLCTKFPLSKLLWWSTLIAIPQMIPMLFVHSADTALILALPIGMLGGLATAAYFDLAMRSCPAGLQGTLMMLVSAGWMLAVRGSDLLGAKLYAADPELGFRHCVEAAVIVYILILPLILWIPKEVIATTDGEPLLIPAQEADDLRPATR